MTGLMKEYKKFSDTLSLMIHSYFQIKDQYFQKQFEKMASSMQNSSEARDDVEEGLEDEEEEGPIPLDDGPVEDEVLDDMDGDDVGFGLLFTFIIFSDAPPRARLVLYLQMLQLEMSISRSTSTQFTEVDRCSM